MPLSRLIGSRLRERRLALGLSQAGVAQAAGISASFLNLIEHNRRRVSADALGRLASALATDPAALSGAGDGGLTDSLRAAGAGTGAEMDRIDEFIGRFPGWAAALARAEGRAGQAERAMIALNDRLTHDPHLAHALHDLLSALSAVRSTAAILAETGEIDAEWRARFHRNLHADAERLATGAGALVAYLDGSGGDPAGVTASPQEEMDDWLAAQGWHLAGLEDGRRDQVEAGIAALASPAARELARGWAAVAAEDAARMPLAAFQAAAQDPDPLRLAAAFQVPVIAAFRRLATLPGSDAGLVICDGSGGLIFRKPARGFVIPRFGSACALWPLFGALARPMLAIERQAVVAGRTGEARFRLRAFGQPRAPSAFGDPDLREAAMLIEPMAPQDGAGMMTVGGTCRICSRDDCPARREPSVLAGL